jgi:cation diffusion facilitator family transporter
VIAREHSHNEPHDQDHDDGDDHRHGPHGHEHGYDRHHRHRGFVAAVRDIFRPHSHDAADSIDEALESDERGLRAVKVSFVALMITALVQVAIVVTTDSVALLADTIHNFSDALTAVPLFIAFRLGRRPPNERYTYGYRRAEDLAGLFVLAMIATSAVVAAWQAIDRLVNPRALDHVGVLFVAGLAGFVGNELVALYRIREGNAIGSAALVADGYHARTDGFTSLAVALSAVGVWAGIERSDPIVGLGISIAILMVLRGAARQVYYRLMDAVDPAIVRRIRHQAEHAPGVVGVHAPTVRWLGHRLVADLTIDVDATSSVEQGHEIATATRHHLIASVTHLGEVHVHVHPATPWRYWPPIRGALPRGHRSIGSGSAIGLSTDELALVVVTAGADVNSGGTDDVRLWIGQLRWRAVGDAGPEGPLAKEHCGGGYEQRSHQERVDEDPDGDAEADLAQVGQRREEQGGEGAGEDHAR